MKILLLFHVDLDGAMSAAIVGLKHRTDEVTYKTYNYGYSLEPSDLVGFDVVYAVDVSFFDKTTKWIYQDPRLIWIDHHQTAIERENLPENYYIKNIPGIRLSDGRRAACELTWDYLFPEVPKPRILEYLSAYDIWDKTRFPWSDTEEIEWGAKYKFGIDPVALINFMERNGQPEELKDVGKILLGNLEKRSRSVLLSNGYYINDFYGYRVVALGTTEFTSMIFTTVYDPKYFDIMMPFTIVPGKNLGESYVRVSLYSENPDIDVSSIATKFGGGGHKGAAGFTMSLETLMELLSCAGPLKSYMEFIGFKGNKPRHL